MNGCDTRTWVLGNQLGEGQTSLAFKACTPDKDCGYIFRITELNEDEGMDRGVFEDSMIMLERFAELGVSPKLKDWWFCETEYAVTVMEYGGITLKQYLSQPLSIEDKIKIGRGVISLLNTIHSHDMFHGDVSPSNI